MTPGRFELPTCGLGNRRSIHLSYGAISRNWRYGLSLQQWSDLQPSVMLTNSQGASLAKNK